MRSSRHSSTCRSATTATSGSCFSIRRWSGCARFPACRTPRSPTRSRWPDRIGTRSSSSKASRSPSAASLPSSAWTPITNEYFDTMGIRLLKGRGFDSRDVNNSPTVIVVNETFARRFFGANNPIGARVKQGWPEDKSPWREIVGVVNDVRVAGLQGDPTLQAYLPVRQVSQGSGAFVVRAAVNPASLGRAIEAAVHEIDPNLPLFNVQAMNQTIEAGDRQRAFDDGAVARVRGTRVIDGRDRCLRCDGVFGHPAHARARRADGARRQAVERAGARAPAGNGRVPDRHRRSGSPARG